MTNSRRLDQLLVERGAFPSRARAQGAIKAGLVRVGGARIDKPSASFAEDCAIEIDGDSQGSQEAQQHDEKRSAFIAAKGVRIIRFWNSDIHERLDGVLSDILEEERIIRNELGAGR